MSVLLMRGAIDLVECGLAPDVATRWAIRKLLRERLATLAMTHGNSMDALSTFVDEMTRGPIAPLPQKANEQHYEVPAAFFGQVLGVRRKYSCCHWTDETLTLDQAEESALDITCQRAEIADRMHVLELGCGWGSLTLWLAEKYPNLHVTAVSNSRSQQAFIQSQAAARGWSDRVTVVAADMNEFDTEQRFDRVVSVEMFEHMRNYRELLRRVASWLRPDGKLFVHIFCHRQFAYAFEAQGESDWMAKYFFSGGIMPSQDLLARFSDHLQIEQQWSWNGQHYSRTCEAWLKLIDARRETVLPVLQAAYGREASRWFHRWRMFFLACSELFAFHGGREWFVSHYLLRRAKSVSA